MRQCCLANVFTRWSNESVCLLQTEDRVSVPLIMVSPAHEVHSLEKLFSNHDYLAFDPKKVKSNSSS